MANIQLPHREIRRLRRRFAGLTAALLAFTGVGLATGSPALATSPGCSTSSHCYSVLIGSGTTYYGMYGTWNRAPISVPSANGTNDHRVNSEMWVVNGNYWVEEGIKGGSFPEVNASGYFAFYAYQNSSGFTRARVSTLTANTSVTDEYQISRSATTNRWNVYFDGSLRTTPDVGFWSSNDLEVGGEVATSDAAVSTFNMYVKGVNASSQFVNLGAQTPTFIPAQPGNPLNGVTYQNSEWSWNTKA